MTTLLIDGDIVAYQAALACEQSTDWGDGLYTNHADLDRGKAHIDKTIGAWVDKFDPKEIMVALTGSTNFRKSILSTYKENRKDLVKPIVLAALKQYLTEEYQAYTNEPFEADDILGTWSTSPHVKDGIIISIDKDFKQIPGWLFNPKKDQVPTLITQDEADYYHLYQALIGDRTDGYVGCPGVGPVKAEKILAQDQCWTSIKGGKLAFNNKGAWEEVVKAFEKAKLTEADALVQARVARISRWEEHTPPHDLWDPYDP